MSRLTIFLDRDGVINRKRPEDDYVKRWEEFEFLPGALEGLALLARRGARVIVITNQRGIARGRFTEADLADIHARMTAAVEVHGGHIDAIYHCPHEEGACGCRKPRTGMFERAMRDIPEIDLANAVVVGDAMSDLQAAARLGCSAVLIAGGEGRYALLEQAAARGIVVDGCAGSLAELAHGGFGEAPPGTRST